jgi:hypothetical protein
LFGVHASQVKRLEAEALALRQGRNGFVQKRHPLV